MRAILTGLIVAGALIRPDTAEAQLRYPAQATAGLFEIATALPAPGTGEVRLGRCDTPYHCTVRVRWAGTRCKVGMVVHRKRTRFPIGEWHCPLDWVPDHGWRLARTKLELQKAARHAPIADP